VRARAEEIGIDASPTDRSCRLCGGRAETAFVVGDRNRRLGSGHFEYRRCDACDAVAISAAPGDLGRYYETGGYGAVEQEIDPELARRERAKLELIADLMPGRTVLEVGPGQGLFTRTAAAAGYELTVIEMDERYCRELGDDARIRAIHSDSPVEAMGSAEPVDAVVMWHVIEHLPDPWDVLARSVEMLNEGGVLALSTPNPDSLQFRLLGGRWAHLDAPRHLQLVPHHELVRRLESFGVEHVRTVTNDPTGLELNNLGWEYAIRRDPARRPQSFWSVWASRIMAFALAPLERNGFRGTAYTSVFVLRRAKGAGPELSERPVRR
jgi:2-polyprenyl-3-methyl-5-hydroxy-6-metoxy-1,4-benzoquinol methylase